MGQGAAGRHAELAAELAEWQEHLWQARTGSKVVLVAVPAGWGRTTVLGCFYAEISGREDAPVTVTVRVDGQDLRGETIGVQAEKLRACLTGALRPGPAAEEDDAHPLSVVELLGLDDPGGRVQLGLGIGGLFFSGLTAGISFLVAGLAAGAAQKAWDASPAGQDGALARTARAIAAVSVHVPVVVIVDDADCLDVGLAVTLAENLTARHGSQVLLVAATDPGSALAGALTTQVRQGVTGGLVYVAEADPDMSYASRLELARQLCPGLPDAGTRRITQRTATFAEVFTVAAAPRLADLGPGSGPEEVLAVVDAAASARLARPAPSAEATVIAWAGGLVHARQAGRALEILGAIRDGDDPDVRCWEGLERLADPASPRLAVQVTAGLAAGDRRAMAAAFLDEALTLTQAPGAGLIDKVAALRAAHRVRGDLPAPGQLPEAQRELVAVLEALGDDAAALQVAAEALAAWPSGDAYQGERDALAAAVIRLSHTTPQVSIGPLAQQLIAEAAAGGATAGLEAQIWAAIVLLDMPGQRDAALTLAGKVTADLEAATGLGPAGDRWRLLLAYHAGHHGLPDLTTRLLAPLVTSGDPAQQDAARVVRRAVDGPGADLRLQNILLEEELAALPPGAGDERLRIHYALAANHATLGDYRQALAHSQHELGLRTRIEGPRHPDTLATRANIARWTGECGDAPGALRLHQELLPGAERVFGPGHPNTLTTRGNIARWTGECGDTPGALRLYRELLPGMERVLGPRHPNTLATRGNIAGWTGRCGDAPGALRLYRELLPDQEQILGSLHPHALSTRDNIAHWTGKCGDAPWALALYRELLPDQEQILGPGHPNTLATRANIAHWTGECGDAPGALALYQELLPGMDRLLGPGHSYTLTTRNNIALLVGEDGSAAGS